jgi:hypothetical protein
VNEKAAVYAVRSCLESYTTFDANRPRERSLAKQFRTETQLLDLVRAHLERFHRGPLLDEARPVKIIHVANDPNRNWRIAYGGVAEDHAVALDEAEAELTELYDLSS